MPQKRRNIYNYSVFKKAHSLTLEIYKITHHFPKYELYSLTSQMRRAAYSIPMNLIEGGVKKEKEFFHYIRIAIGSNAELGYQILLAKELDYIKNDTWKRLTEDTNEIAKMLYAIISNPNNE